MTHLGTVELVVRAGDRSAVGLVRAVSAVLKQKIYVQGVPKKMSFSGKTAITTFKLIQNAKVGGVLENSGYLLHHGH